MSFIEIMESNRCAGACRHCHAASELAKTTTSTWQISFAQKIAIQRLLRETDFSPETPWIHIWNVEKIDHKSVDFGGNNTMFSEATFSMNSVWTQQITDKAQENMFQILWSLSGVDKVTLGLSREQTELWEQHKNLWLIIRIGLGMISGKIKNVIIRGWSNDISIKKFSAAKDAVKSLHDWLRAVRQEGSLEQLGMNFGKEIAAIIRNYPRDTVSMLLGSEENNGTFSIGTGFKFGDKEILIRHDLFDNPWRWKIWTTEWIINSLEESCMKHVLFTWNEVNIFHSTDTTNVPWVWVSLSSYQEILSRASKVGYNQAVIEHFKSLATT